MKLVSTFKSRLQHDISRENLHAFSCTFCVWFLNCLSQWNTNRRYRKIKTRCTLSWLYFYAIFANPLWKAAITFVMSGSPDKFSWNIFGIFTHLSQHIPFFLVRIGWKITDPLHQYLRAFIIFRSNWSWRPRHFSSSATPLWKYHTSPFNRFLKLGTGLSELFSLTYPFRSRYGPGVDSASNRNEYQEYFSGVKAAGA